MTWLLWRQHRSLTAVIGAALFAFAVAVIATGVHMADVYDTAVRACDHSAACTDVGNVFQSYGAIVDTVHLSLLVPVLLGVFLGATLIARETEHATNVLVWTQTVTRRRWLIGKVATALALTLVTSAAVSALVTWWSGTPNALYGNRFEGAQFDTQNVVPIAFALFAVALGIAAGSVVRRVLPAIAVTVGVYVAVRLAVSVFLRSHYEAAVSKVFPLSTDSAVPSGSWTVRSDLVAPSGRVLSGPVAVPQQCVSATTRRTMDQCLQHAGFHTVVRYHPASQYWTFQWIEAAIFVALAVVLVTIGIVVTLRRDA